MSEILFVLTVIFVAYVFCVIVSDKRTIIKSSTATLSAESQVVTVNSQPEPPEIIPEKQSSNTTKSKVNIAVKTAANKKTVEKKALKNPVTGEITTAYNNYRFAKRWIKEALVAEALLEKVYKNNELNDEIEAVIKAAIVKLEGMEQYRA